MTSCKDEAREIGAVKTESIKPNQVQIDTFSFDGDYDMSPNAIFKSELKHQLLKLEELENNYQVISIGKSKIDESIVCRGVKRLPELDLREQFFEMRNLDKLFEGIIEVNYAYIKGTKDMGGKLFPRAKVEELIFQSEDSARRLSAFINEVKEEGYAWENIDKSPNSIFNQKNRIYYISSGGWYMNPFYKEIENVMKE